MKPAIGRSEARLLLLRGVIAVVVAVLIGRLWQLQMVEGASYLIRSDRNRFREVDVAAPRGVIYDRNGKILARNRPSFTIAVVPGDLPKTREGEPDPEKDAAVLDRLLAPSGATGAQAASQPDADPNADTDEGQRKHADHSLEAHLRNDADSRPASLVHAPGRDREGHQ